jgi:hypothetical protein
VSRNDSIKASEQQRNAALQWKPATKDSLLWISKNGDVGIRSAYHLEANDMVECYLTNFNDSLRTPYKNVIDPATYKLFAGDGYGFGGYFKDKKHIYHFWGNSGGGGFAIVDVDYNTFKNLSDCYAIDKNHVYHIRFGLMEDADAKTFTLVNSEHCIAKDKNNFYDGDNIINEAELSDPEIKAIIKKHKK